MGAVVPQSALGLEVVDLDDTDFFEWTQETAEKIRRQAFHEIDLAALAEEIEDLGKSKLSEVISRLTTVIIHLLKLDFQPGKKTNSWIRTIRRERTVLEIIFDQSPSLIDKGKRDLDRTYKRASREAAGETGLPRKTFPQECPYTYEQILDPDFFPGQPSP